MYNLIIEIGQQVSEETRVSFLQKLRKALELLESGQPEAHMENLGDDQDPLTCNFKGRSGETMILRLGRFANGNLFQGCSFG